MYINHFQKGLNGSQLAESTFLTCHCHEIYIGKKCLSKNSNYTLKIWSFVKIPNFGHFGLKNDIL